VISRIYRDKDHFLKYLIILFLFNLTAAESGNLCQYGSVNQCALDKTCVRLDLNNSECIKFENHLPFVGYPFPKNRSILCDQGAQSPVDNSHTFLNTLYALDLKTPPGSEADAIIAGVSGRAYVYNNCKEHNTSCGNGWGNHVRILTASGVVVQYAHLEKVWIQNGQFVKAGMNIGLEGTTGQTGSDNRHLHLSAHYQSDMTLERLMNGILPKSIPFKMNICQLQHQSCTGFAIDIRELVCKRISNQQEWVQTFKI